MGKVGALDAIQGKKLYSIMSAACGSAFMLYGWDAGEFLLQMLPWTLVFLGLCQADQYTTPGVLGGIQATPQFLDAIGNPEGAYVCERTLCVSQKDFIKSWNKNR